MKIDTQLLDKVSAQAKASQRLRMNYDLRDSEDDKSQKMLNALEPGTELPIHRHRSNSEAVVILRGKATQFIYDDSGREIDRIHLQAGGDCPGMVVEKGVWHRLVSEECGTVLLEAKEGAYKALEKCDILETNI